VLLLPSVYRLIFPPEQLYISYSQINSLQSNIELNQKKRNSPRVSKASFFKNNYNLNKLDTNKIQNHTKKGKANLVEINSADSVALVKLYRIGPYLASRIIAYRKSLGGFLNLNQLTEVYNFDEDILFDLKDKIYLDTSSVVKFNLNKVGEEALKNHPYFKYKISRVIVNYRNQHGQYKTFEDLKKTKIITDSILNKIKIYSTLE
jgi:DNA uptake protein ComE-like DNA-binding protein